MGQIFTCNIPPYSHHNIVRFARRLTALFLWPSCETSREVTHTSATSTRAHLTANSKEPHLQEETTKRVMSLHTALLCGPHMKTSRQPMWDLPRMSQSPIPRDSSFSMRPQPMWDLPRVSQSPPRDLSSSMRLTALLCGPHAKTSRPQPMWDLPRVHNHPFRDSSSSMRLTALLCGPHVKTSGQDVTKWYQSHSIAVQDGGANLIEDDESLRGRGHNAFCGLLQVGFFETGS
uniref:Uncharacterized protein n=1 Tax=Tanacetum cinerariifolium TaxID=118510 RepID=A0A6L2MTT1_TANCI|nr:hypothetical protein [Tanacetum cinerariifolium]